MTKQDKKRNKMILCADFETTSQAQYIRDNKSYVYLWCCKELETAKTSLGVNIIVFFNYLTSRLENNIICYFHNLSFDGEFIIWYLIENNFTPKYVTNIVDLNDFEFSHLTADNGSIYNIIVKRNDQIIEFRCSYKLMPVSIKALGVLVGVNKLDEEYDYDTYHDYTDISQVNPIDIEYINNDVEIMRLSLLKAFELGINSMTIASSSYKNWLSKNFMFAKTNLNKPTDEETNNIITLSYRGGMTYLNPIKKETIFYNCKSYDVNSLYPSVMLDNTMPYGDPQTVDFNKINIYKKVLLKIYINYAKIRVNYIPFIPTKLSRYGSYEYSEIIENLCVSLWYEEYKLFLQYYDTDICVLNCLQFNTKADLFKEYFMKWKTIKETTNNPVEKQLSKLMLNSLYGKFGSIDDKASKEIREYTKDYIEYKCVPKTTKYYYRAIASYITSMARVKLINAIESDAKHFIYCDTDSIYMEENSTPDIAIDDKILGYWKDEGTYIKAKFLKTKCYIKQLQDGSIKTTVAGLPKKAQKLVTFDNLRNGLLLKNVKLQFKRVKGGVILISTDFTINC